MLTDKEARVMIQETHDTVIELQTVLLGVPNTDDKGLVGEIKSVKLNQENLNSRHRKLSRNFWILVSFLTGTGLLGGGIYSLLSG